MHHGVWELVFLMVILKIPIIYLCAVVYYAIKAEPRPGEGAGVTVAVGDGDPPGSRWSLLRPRRYGPRRGGPTRTYPRQPRVAHAQGRTDLPRGDLGRR